MIARLGEVSSIFNISEPIMFGLPVVFNPIYTVPFCIVSICFNFNSIFCNCSWLSRTYLYCYPMGNSPLLSGYLSTGDIRGTPSQIVITIIGLLVYAPLVSASNKAAKKQGLETAE
ncbi:MULTISPECIES: hypothetical protein [Thomasclavelia]|uniref:hypothetical protein n=2 Tax=Thomasclavelia TaxID=3025755 RepID=UPI00338FF8A4